MSLNLNCFVDIAGSFIFLIQSANLCFLIIVPNLFTLNVVTDKVEFKFDFMLSVFYMPCLFVSLFLLLL